MGVGVDSYLSFKMKDYLTLKAGGGSVLKEMVNKWRPKCCFKIILLKSAFLDQVLKWINERLLIDTVIFLSCLALFLEEIL
jgi:hypothetical protein